MHEYHYSLVNKTVGIYKEKKNKGKENREHNNLD